MAQPVVIIIHGTGPQIVVRPGDNQAKVVVVKK